MTHIVSGDVTSRSGPVNKRANGFVNSPANGGVIRVNLKVVFSQDPGRAQSLITFSITRCLDRIIIVVLRLIPLRFVPASQIQKPASIYSLRKSKEQVAGQAEIA